MGVTHRDLKLENFIFESKTADSNIKLIDFGLSSKYGSSLRRMETMVGTPYYIAPEVGEVKSGCGTALTACVITLVSMARHSVLLASSCERCLLPVITMTLALLSYSRMQYAVQVLNQSDAASGMGSMYGGSNKGYTNACDCWSLGVIAYMLLSGES